MNPDLGGHSENHDKIGLIYNQFTVLALESIQEQQKIMILQQVGIPALTEKEIKFHETFIGYCSPIRSKLIYCLR